VTAHRWIWRPAQASGYQARQVTIDVSFAKHVLDCGTNYGGGMRLDLSLTPA